MNIERLRKIILYSEKNREEISYLVRKFCSFAEIEYDNNLLNVLQIVRTSFRKKGFLVFEMPFNDKEIGALSYKGDGLGYVVINTSLPRVNSNFAIAHEIYHVFFQKSEFISKVEFANEHYYEHEEEYATNLFASMLLMPETSFRRMYTKFKEESEGNEVDTIFRLMAYYQVPYMAVLIRCFELKLLTGNNVSEELLSVSKDKIKKKLNELWLDESIIEPSNKDDYSNIEELVRSLGSVYIGEGYINEYTLDKALQNMRNLYEKIRGE